MKSDFKLSNLLGTVYHQGNIIFSHDGTQLLSPVGNRVSCFDLVNNQSFTFSYEHRKNIAALDLNPQGNLLLSVDEDGRGILVNFKARTVLHHFNFKEKVSCVKFSPDGQLFALAVGRFIQIWKTPSVSADRQFAPFVRYRIHAGHFADLQSLTWSVDSRFLLSTSQDMTTRIWSIDAEEKDAAMTFSGHRDAVMGAFFNSTQEIIYTVSKDGALFKWEYVTTGDEEEDEEVDLSEYKWRITEKQYFFAHSDVACVTFHAASNMLVVGFANGEFRLYELPHFTMLQQLSMGQNEVNTVAINTTGEWLAFGSSELGQLLVYEWQSESYILKQQGHFDTMNALCYSPDGSRVVTAADDGKIKIWDVVSGFCLATFEEHTGGVTAVQFAKKGQVLFSASLDGTVKAWDLIRYRNFRTFTAPERIQFHSLAVDPSGEVVCASSHENFEIYVWNVQTSSLVDTLAGHEGPVSCLSFSQENSVLASASWDKTVRIWSIFSRSQQVEPLQMVSDVLSITVSPDGTHFAVSMLNGQISIWNIADAKQVGNIDAKKDIISGRFAEDRFAAKNSARAKYFTTINYSFDGLSILAGGNNNSICLYDISNEVLLKRFVVSKNMLLNGTQEMLNSKLEDFAANPTSTSSVDGLSTRRTKPEIRVTCVSFSPTAQAFAAASTAGLLIYSTSTHVFDPFDLDVDVTPENTLSTLEEKEYLHALIMAFRLNEQYLITQVLESIPVSDIALVASQLPVVYVAKCLGFLAAYAAESQHIEFCLLWTKSILSSHGMYIRDHKHEFASVLRGVMRFLARGVKDVVSVGRNNGYATNFLMATDGTVEGENDDVQGSPEMEDSDEEIPDASDDEDAGEWMGFEEKKIDLQLDNEDDDDEDLLDL